MRNIRPILLLSNVDTIPGVTIVEALLRTKRESIQCSDDVYQPEAFVVGVLQNDMLQLRVRKVLHDHPDNLMR